jgi:hypothetical protein
LDYALDKKGLTRDACYQLARRKPVGAWRLGRSPSAIGCDATDAFSRSFHLRAETGRSTRFKPKGSNQKEGANQTVCASPSLLTYVTYFLHPEQDSQHSAEAQHVVFAAFAAPAKPSAITAINAHTFIFFMDFSPLKNQLGFCEPMAMPSA